MQQSSHRPLFSSILVLVLGTVVLVLSLRIPHSMLPNDPGPGFLPGVAGAGLALCGLINLFGRDEKSEPISRPAVLRLAGMLVALVLYVNVLTPLGFVVATPLFLAAMLLLFGNRSALLIVLYSVLFTAVAYVIFRYGLEVALPRTQIGGVRI